MLFAIVYLKGPNGPPHVCQSEAKESLKPIVSDGCELFGQVPRQSPSLRLCPKCPRSVFGPRVHGKHGLA